MTPTDPEGDGNPSARQNHSLTYDATRGIVVLFGGMMEIAYLIPGSTTVSAGKKSPPPI